jgi:hypothetical protein
VRARRSAYRFPLARAMSAASANKGTASSMRSSRVRNAAAPDRANDRRKGMPTASASAITAKGSSRSDAVVEDCPAQSKQAAR